MNSTEGIHLRCLIEECNRLQMHHDAMQKDCDVSDPLISY